MNGLARSVMLRRQKRRKVVFEMAKYICKSCKSLTDGYYKTRNTATLNALLNGRSACTECDSTSLLPVHTPAAKTMIEKMGYSIEEVSRPSGSSIFSLLKSAFVLFFIGVLFVKCATPSRSPEAAPTSPKVTEKAPASKVVKDVEVLPAPDGEPLEVAKKAIFDAGQRCDSVANATRMDDGGIATICRDGSNFLRYRVLTTRLNGKDTVVALKCDVPKNNIQSC